MHHYKHLTLEERENILKFYTLGYSITKISELVNRNKSTISRELKRNMDSDGYYPSRSQEKYRKRRQKCRRQCLLDNPVVFSYVKDKFLNHQWSPEQIDGRLKLEKSDIQISYSTIYRGIYARRFDEPNLSHGNRGAIRKLRHKGKSRHTKDYEERRGKIRISHDIEERPIEANNRSRLGDWEADTVAGKTGKACVVTLVDRKSRFLIAKKIARKNSKLVAEAIVESLENEPCESITPDRGKEFSQHEYVSEKLDKVQFYFPKPHQPWQRGSNENTNGLYREYFPKGEDITDIPEEYIDHKIADMNKRPRKCLGFKTPFEVYYSKSLHLT